MQPWFRHVALLVVILASMTACDAVTVVGTPGPCPASLIEGDLVADGDTLVLHDPSGVFWRLDWPDGFVVQQGNPDSLVDPGGAVVANAGDTVSIGGGPSNQPNTWNACGGVTVIEPV